jgi:hypothetical protein
MSNPLSKLVRLAQSNPELATILKPEPLASRVADAARKAGMLGRTSLEAFVFKRFPPDNKMKGGGRLMVMLTGNTATAVGVPNYTTRYLDQLDDDQLKALVDAVDPHGHGYRLAGYGRGYGSSYKGDPRWMEAKYPGVDSKGNSFRKGEEVLYWPSTKTFMTGPEAKAAWQKFLSEKGDEEGNPYARAASAKRVVATFLPTCSDGTPAEYDDGLDAYACPSTGEVGPNGPAYQKCAAHGAVSVRRVAGEIDHSIARRQAALVLKGLRPSTRAGVLKELLARITGDAVLMDYLYRETVSGSYAGKDGKLNYHMMGDLFGGPVAQWKERNEIEDNPAYEELSLDPKLAAGIEKALKTYRPQNPTISKVDSIDFDSVRMKIRFDLTDKIKRLQAGNSTDPAGDAAEIARIFEELARMFK